MTSTSSVCTASAIASGSTPTLARARLSASLRRYWSRTRLLATTVIQAETLATGCVGGFDRNPTSASCTASAASCRLPVIRPTAATTCGYSCTTKWSRSTWTFACAVMVTPVRRRAPPFRLTRPFPSPPRRRSGSRGRPPSRRAVLSETRQRMSPRATQKTARRRPSGGQRRLLQLERSGEGRASLHPELSEDCREVILDRALGDEQAGRGFGVGGAGGNRGGHLEFAWGEGTKWSDGGSRPALAAGREL